MTNVQTLSVIIKMSEMKFYFQLPRDLSANLKPFKEHRKLNYRKRLRQIHQVMKKKRKYIYKTFKWHWL